MKKKYQTPKVTVIELPASNVLAVASVTDGKTTIDPSIGAGGGQFGRQYNGWNSDDWSKESID